MNQFPEYRWTKYDAIQLRDKTFLFSQFFRYLFFPSGDIFTIKYPVEKKNELIVPAIAICLYSPILANPQLKQKLINLNMFNMPWFDYINNLPNILRDELIEWFRNQPFLTSSIPNNQQYNIFTRNFENIYPVGDQVTTLRPSNQLQLFSKFATEQIIIVTGDPGVGKTSQIPPLILYFECLFGPFNPLKFQFVLPPNYINPLISVSFPRRLLVESAYSEFSKRFGSNQTNNFSSFRFANANSPLLSNPTFGIVFFVDRLALDEMANLSNYTTWIIDELHEHNANMDVMLAIFKLLPNMPRLILMSATISGELDHLLNFFNISTNSLFHIVGRINGFEIQTITSSQLINPSELSVNKIINITLGAFQMIESYLGPNRHVLIFLPTILMISKLRNFINNRYKIIELYRGGPDFSPNLLYSKYPIVILATPIAESSITLPNLYVVIDTGLQVGNDGKLVFISKNSMLQRRGRVGRVSNGIYVPLYNIQLVDNTVIYSLNGPLYVDAFFTAMRLKINIGNSSQFYVPQSDARIKQLLNIFKQCQVNIPSPPLNFPVLVNSQIDNYHSLSVNALSEIIFKGQFGSGLKQSLEIRELLHAFDWTINEIQQFNAVGKTTKIAKLSVLKTISVVNSAKLKIPGLLDEFFLLTSVSWTDAISLIRNRGLLSSVLAVIFHNCRAIVTGPPFVATSLLTDRKLNLQGNFVPGEIVGIVEDSLLYFHYSML